jgi:hypothetical protein
MAKKTIALSLLFSLLGLFVIATAVKANDDAEQVTWGKLKCRYNPTAAACGGSGNSNTNTPPPPPPPK